MRKRVEDLRLPELKKREKSFEYRLRDELKKLGILFVKTKPTITGFPDRLAIGEKMKLVETKAKDGVLSDAQIICHRDLRKLGHDVLVLRDQDPKKAAKTIQRWLVW